MELSRTLPGLRKAGLIALGGLAVLVLSHWGQAPLLGYHPTALSIVPGTYNPVAPARLLDTRTTASIPAGGTVTLQVSGRGGVQQGAGAAVLNLTVTNTGTAGYLTVYPGDQAQPGSSNLNFAQGQTIANLAVVQLSASGTVKIYSSAPADVIVDVGGGFVGNGPAGGS